MKLEVKETISSIPFLVSNRVCVPNKTKDLNLGVFNMITGINKSKTWTKHISCECKCQFDGSKCNLNKKWNNGKCRCEYKTLKEYYASKKDYFWNPVTCSCKNDEYSASSIDDSVSIQYLCVMKL